MYARHFLKMFIWLLVMAAIGIGGLVLANYYSKGSVTTSASTGVSAGN